MTYRFILVFCFIWAGIRSFVAQSETQLVKSSSSFFEKKQYSLAIDGYRQLLSNDLKNTEYNYRYGVCLFYTENPEKSAKHFNYLMEQSQFPIEVYYFKGRLYHLNYEFDNAIKMYENYVRLKTKKSQYFGASEEIKRCQNAKELLKSPRAIQVLRNDQRTTDDYFSAYLFDSINYKLYSQDDFGKKYNAKKDFVPKYVFKRGMKYRFFSSYSNNTESGKDIFYQKKNQNNNWDPPQRLSADINTLFDEDFPFYDEHSGYLYFSSCGHNSMGGYDLFRSKFSCETLKSEKVENLNFPYSSTANDFLFVPNLPGENVIFSTDRNQDIGELSVVEARFNAPVLSSLVASLYFKDNIDPENVAAEFYITNELSQEKFGPFNTNTFGKLYFIVPAPGLYNIESSVHGSQRLFIDTIDIPPHVEGFEFELSANYEMIDSRESMSFTQNLIQVSDMVVDIESIELHEFEKLTVNTKTIEATLDMAITMESKPMADDEIEAKMDGLLDLEVELEDQIRQKIKLIENINVLYLKNDEVDEKIDYLISQNLQNTVKEVDSLNPILYDLLIDRKIVVSTLLDQKKYNESMSDLNTLQEFYSEVSAFNKKAEALLESGNKDSLSRVLFSTSIRPESIINRSSLSEKVRKEIAQMESAQQEIQAQIIKKETELKVLNSQKSEIASKLQEASNIEAWDALSDSINIIQQRISFIDKDTRVLSEKNEILEGQLIYAREGLLNITLIDAEGNDLENKLEELKNKIDVDKYASTELYIRDKTEASQSLNTLKINQNEVRSRVRGSSLNKAMQDSLSIASEYAHIQALNQFGGQEDLVAENQVNVLIQDSEFIINSLSNKARDKDLQLDSNTATLIGVKPIERDEASPIEVQKAINQEVSSNNNARELKGSDASTNASIENETFDVIEAQDDFTNSVNPQSREISINSSKNIPNNQATEAPKETFNSEIVSNVVNTDQIQTNSTPSNSLKDSSPSDSNIKTAKEETVANGISTQNQSAKKFDKPFTNETLEVPSSDKSGEDIEIQSTQVSEDIVKLNTSNNETNLNDNRVMLNLNKKDAKRYSNESNVKVNSGINDGDVLVKVSSKVEQQNNISNLTSKETIDENNSISEEFAGQFDESSIQTEIGQDRIINSSDTLLTHSHKVISQEDITRESELNSLTNSFIQRDTIATLTEVEIAQVNTEFEFKTEIRNTSVTEVTQNNIDPAAATDKIIQSNQNSSVRITEDQNSTVVAFESNKSNDSDTRENKEYSSQEERILEKQADLAPISLVVHNEEVSSSKALSSEDFLTDEVTTLQIANSAILDDKINDAQFIAPENISTASGQNSTKSEIISKGNDLITTNRTSLDEKNTINDYSQNSDRSMRLSDESRYTNESKLGGESFEARIERVRFDNNEGQGSEFGESVKLLTALIFDAELEINEINSDPEPKRKKEKILVKNRREEQQRRLAYFQKELSLELMNQSVENKYLRLKSMIPGVQFETIDNLNAQLLEIEIKEQDLLDRLKRATSQNEINMLNKLIEANRSRKLMIEEELLQMQSFERNEFMIATRAVNERDIESVLFSERYLSYVEKRQKLQEANELLNQLKANNLGKMMALDASLRLSTNAETLTEEQKQMVKDIRELQQAILYLEEEVKLRSSNLELESDSAEYEYLYQNGINPSITLAESIKLQSLSELPKIQVFTRLNRDNKNNKNSFSDQKINSNNSISSNDELDNSMENADETSYNQPNVSLDFSSVDDKSISLENIPSESELNTALVQIKDPLSILESKSYKSYVQDRILANRLAKDYKNISNLASKTDEMNNVEPDIVNELTLKNAIDTEISRSFENSQNPGLSRSDLEKTFDYVSDRKLALIRAKLNELLISMESCGDSSVVYEALMRNEFTEISAERTASFQNSLKSLDLVDYRDNELIKSDFTILNQEVVSKNIDVFKIGTANPSGLNFRVQVGAFRRPVRQDVYREFTPVSGQTLDNGLIVYMAGYFNNSIAAVAAQKQIRSFGYSDAFIVAYCNDERLAFWKGKELERNGTCIANGSNSFIVLDKSINSAEDTEIMENNQSIRSTSPSSASNISSGIIDSIRPSETTSNSNFVNEGKYEEGDISNRPDNNINNNLQETQAGRPVGGINVKGLFYSVQVGAFNRKIRGSELSKIRELDFYESNGLYRYSSGKFLSVDDARLRRTEVVNNGISDAFVVVFFNGKRITMKEASELFKTQGPSVLYRKNEEINRFDGLNLVGSNETLKALNMVSPPSEVRAFSKITKPKQSQINIAQKHTIKIIDKQKIPREKIVVYSLETDSLDKNTIERLNRVGVFHFNSDSSTIKSQAFKTSMANSMLSFYTNGMQVEEFNPDQFIIHSIKMNPPMDGAFGNWLLRSKRIIGFTKLNKDIYLNFYLRSEMDKALLQRELKELRID